MKHMFLLIFMLIALLSCSRDWNSPLENDSDLQHHPQILNIEQYALGFKLQLDYSYSASAVLLFERKLAGAAFEPVTLAKLSSSVFADTTLNMEFDHNLTYRLQVQKGEYHSEYSELKSYNYSSTILNVPTQFSASTIELQGVRLNWNDNSGKETGYIIEKNLDGAGFVELATLPANSQTYMDNISGMPASPQSLIYRIKAFTLNLNSAWQEQNVIYSGLGAPTNLTITDHSFYHFTIAWTRNSTIATGYEIERKKDNGAYALMATVGATVQTFNTELLENGSYTFRVRAVRNSDYSTYTNEVIQEINIVMPTNGLVAYFPFNGNANDESGNGHDGIVYGATLSQNRFGVDEKAFDFDGINDCIDYGNALPDMPTMSVSFWIKQGTDSNGVVFCDADQVAGHDICLRIVGSTINLTCDKSSEYFAYSIDTSITFTNQWKNITWLLSSVQSQLYIDGQLIDTVNQNVSNIGYHGFILGTMYYNDAFGWSGWFSGSIDDFRIYNRALTEAEIQALYHEGGWTGSK